MTNTTIIRINGPYEDRFKPKPAKTGFLANAFNMAVGMGCAALTKAVFTAGAAMVVANPLALAVAAGAAGGMGAYAATQFLKDRAENQPSRITSNGLLKGAFFGALGGGLFEGIRTFDVDNLRDALFGRQFPRFWPWLNVANIQSDYLMANPNPALMTFQSAAGLENTSILNASPSAVSLSEPQPGFLSKPVLTAQAQMPYRY